MAFWRPFEVNLDANELQVNDEIAINNEIQNNDEVKLNAVQINDEIRINIAIQNNDNEGETQSWEFKNQDLHIQVQQVILNVCLS